MRRLSSEDRKKNARAHQLRIKFGITITQYEEILARQGGLCAICSRPQSLSEKWFAVDHDHRTGKVRGLLCGMCNTALGSLQEDPHLCLMASEYLRATSNGDTWS